MSSKHEFCEILSMARTPESSMSANVLISERTGRYTVADLKALEYGSQLEHLTDKPATTKMAALQYSKP